MNSSSPSESSAAEATATPSATLTPSVSMEEVEVRVAEDAGTAVVTVLLDRPSGAALTVPWYTADDTAVSPDDYIGGQGSVTFAPGETRNTISVRIVDDALREDPVDGRHEQFLVLPSRGDGYRLKNGGEALSVVIEDNDGDGGGGTVGPRCRARPRRCVPSRATGRWNSGGRRLRTTVARRVRPTLPRHRVLGEQAVLDYTAWTDIPDPGRGGQRTSAPSGRA